MIGHRENEMVSAELGGDDEDWWIKKTGRLESTSLVWFNREISLDGRRGGKAVSSCGPRQCGKTVKPF